MSEKVKPPKSLSSRLGVYGTRSIPLGETLPPSPHSVFCSLPRLRDIIAYENKEEEVCKKMQGGYPRFINPSFTRLLETKLRKERGLKNRNLRLLSSKAMAERLLHYLPPGSEAEIGSEDSLHWLSFKDEEDLNLRVREFLQHTGSMVFSREAEDQLILRGELKQRYSEEGSGLEKEEDVWEGVKKFLCEEAEAQSTKNIFLSRSGMNAFFSSWEALSKIQKKKGRRIWVQLGWLYVDTMEVLKKFTDREEEHIYVADVQDLGALRSVLEAHSGEIAGVLTEVPTNPLLSTTNIKRLSKLCKEAGAALLLDPSLAGIANVRLLSHCDLLVTSLTKYHGWSGDLIMGLAIPNPESEFYEELVPLLENSIDPPYKRDVERLLYLLEEYPDVIQKINQNTMEFAEFLSKNPHVHNLGWAYHEESNENYTSIAKGETKPGAVLSFHLRERKEEALRDFTSFESFYDRISIPKGPSFGTAFHLLCPFVYLAHYDLTKTKKGCAYLKENGLAPELLRISVGVGKLEELCAAFERALV